MGFMRSGRATGRLVGTPYVCWRCKSSKALRRGSVKVEDRQLKGSSQHQPSGQRSGSLVRRVQSDGRPSDGRPSVDRNRDRLASSVYLGRKSKLEAEFRRWELEHLKNVAEEEERRLREASSLDLSPLTQLILKSKQQRIGTDDDDAYGPGITEKYPALADLEDSEPQRQFFDESIALYEDKSLQMGDLIDFAKTGILGVYIRHARGRKSNATAYIYISNGAVIEIPERVIDFHSPGFVQPAELQPILPFIQDIKQVKTELGKKPELGNVPRELGSHILTKVHDFKMKAIKIQRQSSPRLDNCLQILADENSTLTLDASEAARKVLAVSEDEHLAPEQLYAVHRALVNCDYGVTFAPGSRFGTRWYFLSQKTSAMLTLVTSWWRAYQTRKMDQIWSASQMQNAEQAQLHKPMRKRESSENKVSYEVQLDDPLTHETRKHHEEAKAKDPSVIRRFVSTIRTIILQRRKKRHYLENPAFLGPMVSGDRPDSTGSRVVDDFDPNEAAILKVLLLVAQGEVFQSSSIEALAAMIVRETRLYPDVDSRYANFLLLQELGVISPWEVSRLNIISHLMPDYVSRDTNSMLTTKPTAGFSLELQTADKMQDLRRDWADLNVYCIDNAATTTIDDGISVERIQGDETQLWVHIHVANPTAFLDTDHPLIKTARIAGSTIYLPNVVHGMMDPEFIARVGSLEKDRPCLTFSTRLNEDGDILEDRITPGFIRNVNFLTPSILSEAVGQNSSLTCEDSTEITVGLGEPSEIPTPSRHMKQVADFTSTQIDELKTLYRIAEARLKRRSRYTAMDKSLFPHSAPCSIKVYDGHPIPPDWTQLREINHDPTITLQFSSPSHHSEQLEKVDIVGEIMLLAGTSAAAWCARRGIPAPYRFATSPDGLLPRERFFNELILPLLTRGKPVPRELYMEMVYQAPSAMSIAPRPHEHIGVSAYMRVTSPLRRFPDVLSHFQIEAALRFDADNPGKPQGLIEESNLAYSASQMAEECKHWGITEQARHRLTTESRHLWILRCLMRAFYFGEAKLPRIWTVRLALQHDLQKDGRDDQIFVIEELGVVCQIEESSEIDVSNVKTGCTWEAEIVGIDMNHKLVMVQLLNVMSEPQDFISPEKFRLFENGIPELSNSQVSL